MSWSKQDFVVKAFEEIGIASYIYELSPEQLQSGMQRLDAMMAAWNGKGLRLGYPLPESPGSGNLSDATNVPDAANEAIYTNLAIRLAPTVGKTVSIETKTAAKDSLEVILQRAAFPNERQLPSSTPSGAGNKRIDYPFLDDPTEELQVGNDDILNFE